MRETERGRQREGDRVRETERGRQSEREGDRVRETEREREVRIMKRDGSSSVKCSSTQHTTIIGYANNRVCLRTQYSRIEFGKTLLL